MCQNASEEVYSEMKIVVDSTNNGCPLVYGEPVQQIEDDNGIDDNGFSISNGDDFETVKEIDGGGKVTTHHSDFAQKLIHQTKTAKRQFQLEEMEKENTATNNFSWTSHKIFKEMQSMTEDDEESKELLCELMSKTKEELVNKLMERERKTKDGKEGSKKRCLEENDSPSWGFTIPDKKKQSQTQEIMGTKNALVFLDVIYLQTFLLFMHV